MRLFGRELRSPFAAAERRAITITQNATREEILAFFGLDPANLPAVTAASAMRVPAFCAGVNFLAATMATLTLEAFRNTNKGPVKVGGRLQTIVRDAPNPEWNGWAARFYFWRQHMVHGRGLFAILRSGGQPYELWPLNAYATRVSMNAFGEKTYTVSVGAANMPVTKSYPAADVIDVPFMLADDQCNALSAVRLGEDALQLALAMNKYGSTFFAGGGVPPLAVTGPLAQGNDAMRRGLEDVWRAIEVARSTNKPMFALPSGHTISQVGYDPAKGQMTEARLFQVQELGRVLGLPPVFVGDLSTGTFSNTEQQDVFLVKHRVGQLAKAFEDEANLKLFGQMNTARAVRHDLDSLQRGDFLSRQNGLTRSVQGGVRTPNEARQAENLPKHKNPAADELYMQGATVPLNDAPTLGNADGKNGDTNGTGNQG